MNPLVATFARSGRRPCTHLTAAFVVAYTGYYPADLTRWQSWRDLNRPLWEAINVHEELGDPWSGPPAVADAVGSEVEVFGPDEPLPGLDPGIWYFVQRWWGLGAPKPIGHSYLVRDGEVHESGVGRGYKVSHPARFVPAGCQYQLVRIGP